jgi:Holliday junction resolvase YEN1
VSAAHRHFLLSADISRIYKEIGPGKRIALSKLALEKFEDTGRPLRIAIDTSIWLFQIQASKGM